ncbi:MAG: ATP synthase F1 subunit delta [Oscillospiraceae bacterium]|nr:ATP synthase F1 subunit delta [Oscillospiraceae bacterium]
MARLSAVYATALFELAMESGSPEEYHRQALSLLDALGEPECKGILMHPQISAAQKSELLTGALSGRIHEDLIGFIKFVIDKNREAYLLPALIAFIEKLRAAEGRVTAYVRTARQLDEQQEQELTALLSEKLGKTVELEVTADPSVIGGFSVYADGFLVDRTVKKQLQDLKTSVKRGMTHDS